MKYRRSTTKWSTCQENTRNYRAITVRVMCTGHKVVTQQPKCLDLGRLAKIMMVSCYCQQMLTLTPHEVKGQIMATHLFGYELSSERIREKKTVLHLPHKSEF